jgi:hypothetical protein
MKLHATESQQDWEWCEGSQCFTQAQLPEGVPKRAFAPCPMDLVALLAGQDRLSKLLMRQLDSRRGVRLPRFVLSMCDGVHMFHVNSITALRTGIHQKDATPTATRGLLVNGYGLNWGGRMLVTVHRTGLVEEKPGTT